MVLGGCRSFLLLVTTEIGGNLFLLQTGWSGYEREAYARSSSR